MNTTTYTKNKEDAILVDGVHLTLPSAGGEVNILRGVDFRVARGESVSLVGPSGSGKSTLLMVMAGLERPTTGSITVVGQDMGALDEDGLARLRRKSIGIVFQSFHLAPTMTALENVAIPLEFAGETDAFEQARAELDRVGLSHRIEHYPSQLSGGEQQRVALARAVVGDPAILMADEPTGNLDGTTGAQIMSLMFELQAARQATLVLITHDMALAARCQRMIHLKDGLIEKETRQGDS
ncbi:MAG: ABC transporter ATP-binding protein [Parvularculales bacterium]